MKTKCEKASVWIFCALFLLPALAAGGQNKAVKKTIVPKLNSGSSGFTPFKTVESRTTEVTGGAEVGGGQYAGGAGVTEGADLTQSSGGGTQSSATGSGSGGGGVAADKGSGSVVCAKNMWGGKVYDCAKRCPKVGWPPIVKTGNGRFSTAEGWGYWYSNDGYSGPPTRHAGEQGEYDGEYLFQNQVMRGAYGQTGQWFNECNGSSGSPWYPDSGNGYIPPPATVCKPDPAAPPVTNCGGTVSKSGASTPAGQCIPPAKMSTEEKIAWWCSQSENQGPDCSARARLLTPYISEYAKYPGLDTRGCPLPENNGPWVPNGPIEKN